MHRYVVSSVEQITPSTALLSLKKHSDESRLFAFEPGQYAAISFTRNGKPSVARCFSIVTSPTEQGVLQFAMRTRGSYTSTVAQLSEGVEVYIRGPFGGFVFDSKRDERAVMIAGGIGITPFMSMLNYASALQLKNDIRLVYSVANVDDIPFYQRLLELQGSNPNSKVEFVVAEGDLSGLVKDEQSVTTGRISEAVLRPYTTHANEATYFICGPPPFMAAVVGQLQALGVHKSSIMTEAFSQGPSHQTGRLRSWPQNMYLLGGLGMAAGSLGIMVSDIIKNLPQTAYSQGNGAINLFSSSNKREQDLDDLISSLASNDDDSVSSAAKKAIDSAAAANAAAANSSSASSSASSSTASSSSSASSTPVVSTPVQAQPVCTTSQSGITTCN